MCIVYDYKKEYKVLLARRPDDKQLQAWARGVVLEDGHRTRPAQVRFSSTVVRILRIRIGTLTLGKLKPRQWRYLTKAELDELRKLVSRKK